jgi:alpha-ketoglutarate-dependent taurine dioxygenase
MVVTVPLHEDFGVEVEGLDLRDLTAETFPEIRALFEEHSLLLFRGQNVDEDTHRRVAEMFGPSRICARRPWASRSKGRWCRTGRRRVRWSTTPR